MNKDALNSISKSVLALFILLTAQFAVPAQVKEAKTVPSGRNAEKIMTEEKIRYGVEFLSDTTFGGRATGSRGASEAAFWISRCFMDAGLMAMSGSYSQSFRIGDDIGHNIIGFMPGARRGERETYVVLTAHYDTYGSLDGKILPGADSNASGVVALTGIADMLKYMKDLGRLYGSNIIFLATDAKERSSAGAEAFMNALEEGLFCDPISQQVIDKKQIKSVVVLDILGATLEPIHKGRKDYLIMLGSAGEKYDLSSANGNPGLGLDLGFDYYGSKSFTQMFHHNSGDQRIFFAGGLPVTLFTSGITRKTNKVDDDWESLNYEVFRKRIVLIFHWLTKIL
ncbi:MAG: M28 family peptidase [Candidatus Cryptobacteroides sp.]